LRLYSTSSRLTGTMTRGLDKLLALSPSPACQGRKQTSLVMFRESRVLRWRWNTLLVILYILRVGRDDKETRYAADSSPSPACQAVLEFCGGGGIHTSSCIPHLPGRQRRQRDWIQSWRSHRRPCVMRSKQTRLAICRSSRVLRWRRWNTLFYIRRQGRCTTIVQGMRKKSHHRDRIRTCTSITTQRLDCPVITYFIMMRASNYTTQTGDVQLMILSYIQPARILHRWQPDLA
jgi:hypothetical protein